VNRTAPYGHNGRYPDLISVVRHLNTGGYFKVQGKKGDFHDPNIEIKPLGWSAEDEKIVAEFLVTAFDGADFPLIGAP
jgi:cytochrome c peroxidase